MLPKLRYMSKAFQRELPMPNAHQVTRSHFPVKSTVCSGLKLLPDWSKSSILQYLAKIITQDVNTPTEKAKTKRFGRYYDSLVKFSCERLWQRRMSPSANHTILDQLFIKQQPTGEYRAEYSNENIYNKMKKRRWMVIKQQVNPTSNTTQTLAHGLFTACDSSKVYYESVETINLSGTSQIIEKATDLTTKKIICSSNITRPPSKNALPEGPPCLKTLLKR